MMASAVPNMLVLAGDSGNSAAAFNQQIWKYNETANHMLHDTVQ
jgi:hypothetical protein